MSLYDELSKKLAGGDDEDTPPIVGQQQSLAATLRAKTGKVAAPGATPVASNLGEEAALGQASTAIGQQQAQGVVQAAGVQQAAQDQATQLATQQAGLAAQRRTGQAAIATAGTQASEATASTEALATSQQDFNEQQHAEILETSADKQLRQLAADRGMTVYNIFRDADRENKDLAFRKDASDLEHKGRLLALRDKDYVAELNRVGQERDLKDKLNFQDEQQRLVLGDQMDALIQEIGFKDILNADQRTFNEKLARLDNHTMLQMANRAITDDNRRETVAGVNQVAKSGIQAYAKYDSTSDDDKAPVLDNMEKQSPEELTRGGQKSDTIANDDANGVMG